MVWGKENFDRYFRNFINSRCRLVALVFNSERPRMNLIEFSLINPRYSLATYNNDMIEILMRAGGREIG